MTKRFHLAFVVLLAVSAACAQTISERTPISEDRIVSALAGFHLAVQKSQVQFLSDVSSKSRSGNLQLVEVQRWNQSDALAKFLCAKSGDCLPFFVAIHWPTSVDRDLALAGSNRNRTVRAFEKPSFRNKEMLVRAGQTATLIIDNSKFHATTPIICLQAGSQGQKVRIATLDRKKIALAEVIDSGVLRGSF
jgi:hypothetical protein